MPLTPGGFVHEREIQSAIERVEARFAQDIDHINYNFGGNWFGGPSIFFRVVLRDGGSGIDHLVDLAQDISIALMNEAETDEHGLYAYFDFRSAAEQAKLKDPAWA